MESPSLKVTVGEKKEMSMNQKTVKYGKISNVVIMIFPDDLEAEKYVNHIKNATLHKALQGLKTAPDKSISGLLPKPLNPNPLRPRIVA